MVAGDGAEGLTCNPLDLTGTFDGGKISPWLGLVNFMRCRRSFTLMRARKGSIGSRKFELRHGLEAVTKAFASQETDMKVRVEFYLGSVRSVRFDSATS